MQLTKTQLEFLAGLSKSPTGRALVELIQAKLAEEDKTLRRATGEAVYRSQGRAQVLEELLGDLEEADKRLSLQQVRRSVPAFTS